MFRFKTKISLSLKPCDCNRCDVNSNEETFCCLVTKSFKIISLFFFIWQKNIHFKANFKYSAKSVKCIFALELLDLKLFENSSARVKVFIETNHSSTFENVASMLNSFHIC